MSSGPITELIIRQRIFAVVFIIFILLLTIEFIRRRKLKEKYAILWLAAGVTLIPLLLWPDLLRNVSNFLGVSYTPATILLIGVLFILFILFHFSIALSQAGRKETKLVLRITELEERINDFEKKIHKTPKPPNSDDDKE
jgi:hypothetical protein